MDSLLPVRACFIVDAPDSFIYKRIFKAKLVQILIQAPYSFSPLPRSLYGLYCDQHSCAHHEFNTYVLGLIVYQ